MNDNQIFVHWSELSAEELIHIWQDIDAGTQGNFFIAPVKKLTRRKRGEHSTKAKCENTTWYRQEHYKKLSGQLVHAYNHLVKKDKETGQVSLRMHVFRPPLYVAGRRKAWRIWLLYGMSVSARYALASSSQLLCAGKHTVGMCISRLAKEQSTNDAKGNVILETKVTVSRILRLIEEQVRFGILGLAEERF
ncbi:plasmid replication initiator RepA [Kosakonia sp. S42]|uniref:plasmid replication initiator RepA n=1 Tax=Kosakonia sp. S42 TaxID=2767458 RepID=UPI001F3FB034|nr:plasmid replication initiator RepA [Kosakonia sp. S42]